MGSTRLPGKIALPLLGRPLLWWVVNRVKQCRLIHEIVIATTVRPQDDVTEQLCTKYGWPCYRGSEEDVLDRYYQAARAFAADHVVRITSDCPLIDPSVLELVTAAYAAAAPPVDYASNSQQRSYPRGLDSEIFSADALKRAWSEDRSSWREHVTPYFYKSPSLFRLLSIVNPIDYSHHRWTVDTAEDFELIRHIYNHFGHGDFGWRDVLDVLADYPEWVEFNQHIEQKKL